ncbi:hypothetical protein [Streptosporangium sandarakinum]
MIVVPAALSAAHAGEDPLSRVGLDTERKAETVAEAEDGALIEDGEALPGIEGLQASAGTELAVGAAEAELEVQGFP